MERYDTSGVPDPFASTMEAVKSLAARLSAPETAGLDHGAVEHLIEVDGREILRVPSRTISICVRSVRNSTRRRCRSSVRTARYALTARRDTSADWLACSGR